MINADVCNMALCYIGKAPIVTIDDNSDNARKCKAFYDNTRQQLLRCYEWNFARKQARLALVDMERTDSRFIYNYPEDCLLAYNLFSNDGLTTKFKVVAINKNVKGIATNLQDAHLDYLSDVEDLDIWPPDLVSAFAHLLASKIAIPLAGSSATVKEQLELYQMDLMNAKQNAAYEQYTKLNQGGYTYLRSR